MTSPPALHPARSWRALGTYVQLNVEDPAATPEAVRLAESVLTEVDLACSRFRADSDLVRANQAAGQWVTVGRVLIGAVQVAIRAAQSSGGAVDPTLGEFMVAGGYDRPFSQMTGSTAADAMPDAPTANSWGDIEIDGSRLKVPVGVALDLGATGKAFAADLAALTVVERLGVAAIVSVGGDVRAHAPEGAEVRWEVDVAPDVPTLAARGPGVCRVPLSAGGLATSSVTARRWVRAGSAWHHVVDPRTGRPAGGPWLAVTAYGACAADANTATTAALVVGSQAPEWLADHGVAARLLAVDGSICRTPAWPTDHEESL